MGGTFARENGEEGIWNILLEISMTELNSTILLLGIFTILGFPSKMSFFAWGKVLTSLLFLFSFDKQKENTK